MASATLSDYLLHSAVWFTIAALIVMLLLLLKIARLRTSLIARQAHERRFMEVWQPLLAAAVAGERDGLPPLAKEDHILFLKLWNHLHESVRGNAKKQLNIIALRLGMMQQAYALLHKRNLGAQLLALTTLGHLGDRHDWAAMLERARQPDPLLSLVAVRALFQIDPGAALHDLQQLMIEREDWPTAQLSALIEESGTESTFAALADVAASLAGSTSRDALARLHRLLHLLEAAPYQQTIPAVRLILARTPDDEVVAQCLKFLREPNDLHFARANVAHNNWVVRLQAARALGRCGAAGDVAALAALLGDPVWWVRYRTAQALMALLREDAQALSELRARLDDQYGRDMLDMVAAEREAR